MEVFEELADVISAKVIKDRATGRSKGYGFVAMENEAAAQTTIDTLDGTEINGQPVKVSKAPPKEKAGNRR